MKTTQQNTVLSNMHRRRTRAGRGLSLSALFVKTALVIAACAIAACAIAACATAAYRGLGAPDDTIPFSSQVRHGQLSNGLTYFILPNAKPENRAYLTLAIKAGSVDEDDNEQGLAHFVEHMAFNGTERFPELQLLDYLRSLGMRFGAHANAYTSYDETVYSIEVPVETVAGRKIIPDKALAIIDDWAAAVLFTEKDVVEERAIIMEEYRARLSAQDRVQQQVLPVIYRDSKYKDRRPIGLPEIFMEAPASRLKDFYQKWYRRENMAVILVGDFDEEALEASLEEHLGWRNPPGGELPQRDGYPLAPPEKNRFEAKVITDEEWGPTSVSIYYKQPPRKNSDTLSGYREDLTRRLMFQILNTRFAEKQEDVETPFTGAYSGLAAWGSSPETEFLIFAGSAKEGRSRETLRDLLAEKERARRYGFTKEEIERAKSEMRAGLERLAAEKDKIESGRFESELIDYYLRGGSVAGIEWEVNTSTALLPHITADDLKKTFASFFRYDDVTVFVVANENERESLPLETDIEAAVAEASRARVARPENRAAKGSLLAARPQPGRIIAETPDAETGAAHLELDNGARVLLMPTQNKNDEILLSALSKGGYAAAGTDRLISARLASDLLSVSGAGRYSLNELLKLLAGKQSSVSYYAGVNTRMLSGSTTVKDATTLFELLHLVWTEPRLDEKAVKAYVDRMKTSLKREKENPDQYFFNELQKTLAPGDPYHAPLESEDLDRISLSDAREFADFSRNPADWTFVFTGNIDIPAFKSLIETYLASIPRREASLNSFTNIPLNRPTGSKTINKGKEARTTVYIGYFVPAAVTERAALSALALGGYLEIYLNDLIRERLGGVYSLGVNASLDPIGEGGLSGELSLELFFYCDPERAAELSAEIHTQITRLAAGSIDREMFGKAVEAMVKEWEEGMQQNGYIAGRYAQYLTIYDWPLSTLSVRDATLRTLTPDDVLQTARALSRRGPFTFMMEPEARMR